MTYSNDRPKEGIRGDIVEWGFFFSSQVRSPRSCGKNFVQSILLKNVAANEENGNNNNNHEWGALVSTRKWPHCSFHAPRLANNDFLQLVRDHSSLFI